MQEDFSNFVPNVRFEKIPIRNLVSNQDYQRNLSRVHINRTADNFDLYQINPVKVSRRDGINYVFNGQHTIEIVARVSGSRDTPVWCMVYDDLEYTTEADIFAKQQKYVKALTPYEIFMANIEAGNPVQLTIQATVHDLGLSLASSGKASRTICAISALEYIFNRYGLMVLQQTLMIVVATWEGDPFSLAASMLKGIAKLIVCYGESLNMQAFRDRLSRVSAKEITRSAKDRRNGSMGFAEAILLVYNKRTKHPLRMGKLYNNKYIDELEDVDETQDMDLNDEMFDDDEEQQMSFENYDDDSQYIVD